MASLARTPFRRKALTSLQLQSILPLTPSLLRPTTYTLTPPRQHSQRPQPQPHLPIQPQRPYHSDLHPRLPDHAYTNSQTAILTASLPHIPTHGFTLEALTLGSRDAGFLDVSVQLLPRGEFDLILFWLASRRGILRAKVEEGGLLQRLAGERGGDVRGLDVEEKCRLLVLERLRMNGDVKGVWQDVSIFPSLPFPSSFL